MTNTTRINRPGLPVRLTNGDLNSMDAGQLREHLAEHINDTRRGAFAYVDGVAGFIANLTGFDRADVIDNACTDAEAAR